MNRLQYVVVTLSVWLFVVSAVPLGILPDVQHAAPSPGRLAGVVSSPDPASLYKWLLQLFSQRSFINWLGRTRGINFQPGVRPNSGGTSDLFNGGTGDPFATGRLEEGDPQAVDPDLDIVRDYSPEASPQSTTTAPPTVQRDFQADNIIIPQTVQPQDDSGLNIPVLSLQETEDLADDSTRNPSPATLPDDLVIIRDQQNEESVGHAQTSTVLSDVFVHSRLSETNFATRPSGVDVQTVNSSPLQVVTSRNLEDLQVERDEKSPDLFQVIPTDVVETTRNVTSGSDDVSNLPVARDREGGSTSQTLPPDLVVIRDSVEDEDSGHIVTKRVTNSPSQLSTKQIGNGILILLPGDGGK